MIPSFSGQMSLSFFSETTNNLIQTLRDVQTDQIQDISFAYTQSVPGEHFQVRFIFSKPIIIADSGLLSDKNIKELRAKNYQFILGARIKNENQNLKKQILANTYSEGSSYAFPVKYGLSLHHNDAIQFFDDYFLRGLHILCCIS